MIRIITAVLILITFTITTLAQSIVIEGTIKDANDKDVLPYASIFLKKSYFGTISNTNGDFKIVVPLEGITDSLVISYIGYKEQIFSISEIKEPLQVFLEQDQTSLSEVVITNVTAASIVQKAIKKIPVNYATNPYKFTGFYRVTSKKDESYIHLSEAVFELYQSKVDNAKRQFKLEKMRAIKDEKASKGFDLGLNPKAIYGLDIVNNLDEIALLNKKGLKRHTFKIEGSQLINGREAYKITFDQKDIKKPGYRGYMLINKETLAFEFFDFGLSPKGKKYLKFGDASMRALMKIMGVYITMSDNDTQIHYKKLGDKYYLNNVGNDAVLNFKSDRQHFNFDAKTRVDYLVTKVETNDISPFTNEETLGKRKLIEGQNSVYDPDFWKDYTIVLPTSDFNEIAKILEANNKANDFKIELEERLQKLPKDKSVRIDSILQFYHQKKLFNGNALILLDGQTIFEKSYNNSLTSNKPNSQFRIGSLSKTFTSMLIAQLEQEGKLNFTDSISSYLPNFEHGDVTISELLSHQSGIPNYLTRPEYFEKILANTYALDELVTLFCSDALTFEPGSKFEYSNSNFVILSLIAEKIIGTDFSEILNQRIFKPLNMADTYFGDFGDASNLVTGFMYGKPEPEYSLQNVAGAGGIISTTADLLKWSKALETEQLISRSNFENLIEPKAEYIDWDAYYGYGWMIDRYMFSASKESEIYYHPGTDFGFYSMFVKQPELGITIILLSNTGEFPRFELTELMLNQLND